MPDKKDIRLKKVTPNQCPSIDTYIAADGRSIPFLSIAQGWKDAGMNPKYCKNALRVIGGECQPPSQFGQQLCDVDPHGDGDPGMNFNLYQLDSIKPNTGPFWAPPSGGPYPEGLDLHNPCHAAISAYSIFMTQDSPTFIGSKINSYGSNPSCYAQPSGTNSNVNNAPETTPVQKEGQQAKWDGPDSTCNWEGPFCHEDNRGGRIWNGGGNPSFQGSPWPCYGHAQFLKQTGDMASLNVSEACSSPSGSTCNAQECEILRKKSDEVAQSICDQVK